MDRSRVVTLTKGNHEAVVTGQLEPAANMVRVTITKVSGRSSRKSTYPLQSDETIDDALSRVVLRYVLDDWTLTGVLDDTSSPQVDRSADVIPLVLNVEGIDWEVARKAFSTFGAHIDRPLRRDFSPLPWGQFQGRATSTGWQIRALIWVFTEAPDGFDSADEHLAILAQLPVAMYLAYTPDQRIEDAARALQGRSSPRRAQLIQDLRDAGALPAPVSRPAMRFSMNL